MANTTDETLRMEKDQERIRLSKMEESIKNLESTLASTQKELADERLARSRIECERDLIQLEAEGFVFDRVEEVAELAPLPADQRTLRLEKMRKTYRKGPPSNKIIPTHGLTGTEGGGKLKLSKEEGAKLAEYALEHDMDFKEALRHHQAGTLTGFKA